MMENRKVGEKEMEITICIQIISNTSYIDNNLMQHPKVFVVSLFQARRKRMQ